MTVLEALAILEAAVLGCKKKNGSSPSRVGENSMKKGVSTREI